MSSKPASVDILLLELINVKWSDKYDNDRAKHAVRWAMEDEPELTESWLEQQLRYYEQEDRPKSWRDHREFAIQKRFNEITTDNFIDNFDTYYEEQPWNND